MKIAVVAHAKKNLGGGLPELRTELRCRGQMDVAWHEVMKSKQVPDAVRAALAADPDLLLLWGGDGTIQRALDTVAGVHDPELDRWPNVDYMTNVSILEFDTVPDHLVIVGGSYIELEFAQMYRRFGADVTVIERGPRLAAREDPDVSAAIKDILEARESLCSCPPTTFASSRRRGRGDAAPPINSPIARPSKSTPRPCMTLPDQGYTRHIP